MTESVRRRGMTAGTEGGEEGLQVKRLGVRAADKWPLLLPSCLAAPGWKKRRSRIKREEMGQRMEGHTRQWGLCGRLPVSDGRAARTRRGPRVDRKRRRGLDKVSATKRGWDGKQRDEGKVYKCGIKEAKKTFFNHPVSLYGPECTLSLRNGGGNKEREGQGGVYDMEGERRDGKRRTGAERGSSSPAGIRVTSTTPPRRDSPRDHGTGDGAVVPTFGFHLQH